MAGEKKMKVTLELTEAQARTVLHALDAYSRIGCGQFQIVREVVVDNWPKHHDYEGVSDLSLGHAKRVLFPELGHQNASFSIPNREVPVTFRRAWDIYKHLEQALAVARDPNPSFRGVQYDGAILNVSDEALPVVKVEKLP